MLKSMCPFCRIVEEDKIISKNKYGYVYFDKFPVNEGHLLIIPYRHVESYFDTEKEEKNALWDLVDVAKQYLDKKFNPAGYNIGINIGEFAGQTIDHLHIHLIPRYKGDINNPRGGIRGVIPDKKEY